MVTSSYSFNAASISSIVTGMVKTVPEESGPGSEGDGLSAEELPSNEEDGPKGKILPGRKQRRPVKGRGLYRQPAHCPATPALEKHGWPARKAGLQFLPDFSGSVPDPPLAG